MNIQMLLISQQVKTYSHVLTIAREVEQGLEKKNQTQMQIKQLKRLFPQMVRGRLVRFIGSPPAK